MVQSRKNKLVTLQVHDVYYPVAPCPVYLSILNWNAAFTLLQFLAYILQLVRTGTCFISLFLFPL